MGEVTVPRVPKATILGTKKKGKSKCKTDRRRLMGKPDSKRGGRSKECPEGLLL